jgi:predicted transcriptional regulator
MLGKPSLNIEIAKVANNSVASTSYYMKTLHRKGYVDREQTDKGYVYSMNGMKYE